MTDLTPAFNALLSEKGSSTIPLNSKRAPSPDEFLKEAYRINNHISSLLKYLHKTRPAYLSITAPTTTTSTKRSSSRSTTSSPAPAHHGQQAQQQPQQQQLTDTDRDNIDHSTSLLLHDLNTSITTLSSAETLRHETATNLLARKYGHGAAAKLLWKWAGGGSLTSSSSTGEDNQTKKPEQHLAEEKERYIASTRESVLWFLRRGLDEALAVQRGMVERRIERIREKEKSVLYKVGGGHGNGNGLGGMGGGGVSQQRTRMMLDEEGESAAVRGSAMDAKEVAAIEAELSPEQLQLFAEENDSMVRYYEETLSKVQNAEKSLLEIASLQQTLVTHLSTQEEYVEQLVMDASSTETNIGQGNRELKRASERKSTAQAVFWGTVGLCTGLVVWDLIF